MNVVESNSHLHNTQEHNSQSQRDCQPSGMAAARLPVMGDDIFIPIHIHENDVYEGASKIIKVLRPNWKLENVIYKVRFSSNTILYPFI